MKLTAPLGAARSRLEAAPRARPSASVGAAAYPRCSADTTEERIAHGGDPSQVHGEQLTETGFFGRLSGFAANGLRYWEPRRFIYNGVLALVVLGHFLFAWPGSLAKLSFDLALGIFLLAVLANVAYCAAYLADLFVQFAGLQVAWRWGRVALLTVGTMFAATITHFFARGMFGG